ncbi:MAG: GNAT family N-acetyltransferase [Acidimicrobiales bacterium]
MLFMCRDETGILGTLTLILFRIHTGIRAWIEDVIVDEAGPGKGVGRILNEAAVDHAFARGAITVDLTSRPSRRGGEPSVSADRVRAPGHQRVPLQPAGAATADRAGDEAGDEATVRPAGAPTGSR